MPVSDLVDIYVVFSVCLYKFCVRKCCLLLLRCYND